jgi:hypothetical protein
MPTVEFDCGSEPTEISAPVAFLKTVLKALIVVEAAVDDYMGDDYEKAADALDALRLEVDQACGGQRDSLETLVSQLTAALLDAGVKLEP